RPPQPRGPLRVRDDRCARGLQRPRVERARASRWDLRCRDVLAKAQPAINCHQCLALALNWTYKLGALPGSLELLRHRRGDSTRQDPRRPVLSGPETAAVALSARLISGVGSNRRFTAPAGLRLCPAISELRRLPLSH